MRYENFDGDEVIEESNEDDDIASLLRYLAVGLDDGGDFDYDSSVLEPCLKYLPFKSW